MKNLMLVLLGVTLMGCIPSGYAQEIQVAPVSYVQVEWGWGYYPYVGWGYYPYIPGYYTHYTYIYPHRSYVPRPRIQNRYIFKRNTTVVTRERVRVREQTRENVRPPTPVKPRTPMNRAVPHSRPSNPQLTRRVGPPAHRAQPSRPSTPNKQPARTTPPNRTPRRPSPDTN